MGYAAIALPELNLNENQASWFASIDFFASIIFTPLGGLLSEFIGRKKTLLLCSPLGSLGWIFIGTSRTNEMILAGRTLTSIAITSAILSPSKSTKILLQIMLKYYNTIPFFRCLHC